MDVTDRQIKRLAALGYLCAFLLGAGALLGFPAYRSYLSRHADQDALKRAETAARIKSIDAHATAEAERIRALGRLAAMQILKPPPTTTPLPQRTPWGLSTSGEEDPMGPPAPRTPDTANP